MDSEPNSAAIQPVEPPRGMFPARLDEKGRMKMPAEFQRYFATLSEKKLFVTSLDRRIAQIYPINVWRENEKFFDGYLDDPQSSEDVAFNAMDLGAEAEMDNQGRILFNPDLRRDLDLSGQELHIFSYKGRVQVLTEALYQERRQRATPSASSEAVKRLERAGLK